VPLTITFDLEDNRRDAEQEPRFVAMTERFLDFADRHALRATVFIVGELARTHPRLVREVAARGHEIGLHGLRHVALGDVGPNELREGRELLEDVAQAPVRGFRAPIFSLTPRTAWAIEDLHACGFDYSSSVLPAASPLHGWPGAPRTPFRWTNGLVELPVPVAGVGRATIPFLGGIYVRYVPTWIGIRWMRRLDPGVALWSYLHPYDLDPEEPFFVLPYAGWLTSRLLHMRRGKTLTRIERLLEAAGGAGPPLVEQLERVGFEPPPVVA